MPHSRRRFPSSSGKPARRQSGKILAPLTASASSGASHHLGNARPWVRRENEHGARSLPGLGARCKVARGVDRRGRVRRLTVAAGGAAEQPWMRNGARSRPSGAALRQLGIEGTIGDVVLAHGLSLLFFGCQLTANPDGYKLERVEGIEPSFLPLPESGCLNRAVKSAGYGLDGAGRS